MSGKYERDNRMEERKSGIEESERGGSFSGNRNSAPGRNAAKSKAPVGNAAAKQKPSRQASAAKCPHFGKCGGCQYLHLSYEEQLAAKKHQVKELMEKHCKVRPIIGMDENPWHYRHKVQAVFGLDRKKQQISGVYEEKPIGSCRWRPA